MTSRRKSTQVRPAVANATVEATTGVATAAAPRASTEAAPRAAGTLAAGLVSALGERIRSGRLVPGDRLPTEAEIVAGFGVSRTVVREALSRLQAAGLVHTRHGVGTFVAEPLPDAAFRIAPAQLATLHDVIAVLELRIGLETEAAALAAQRRTDAHLQAMRQALDAFERAVAAGESAVQADFRFHHEVAQATQNTHFAQLLGTLGPRIIPRARLDPPVPPDPARLAYLQRVHGEHESILDAIAARDADAARAAMRTHLANSRERRRREAAAGLAATPAPWHPVV
jgi:DNA-binding FadR family transcriptional regulator